MKLIIDLDGVVFDTIQTIVDMYNEDHIAYKDFTPFDSSHIYSWNFLELNLESPEYIDKYFNTPRFFDKLILMNGVEWILNKLLNTGFEIIFCSIGTYPNLCLKDRWIKEKYPEIKFISLDSSIYNDKSDIPMEGCIYIDDVSDNLNSSNATIKICFGKTYEWNQDWEGIRCVNWIEVYEYIIKLENIVEERDKLIVDDYKDIYCITNNINGRKYIGQAKNSKERIQAHIGRESSSLIHAAIRKYGSENFTYSILEEKVDDYNEREKFWIKELNTLAPSGYNMTTGGEGYPHYKGCDMYNSKLTWDEIDCILHDDLYNPSLTVKDIANKYKVGESVIYSINYGISYHNDNIKYPIRDKYWIYKKTLELLLRNFSPELIDELIYLSLDTIKRINEGKTYKQENIDYPIYMLSKTKVKCNFANLEKIRDDLINNHSLSISQIAQKYNTSKGAITQINIGNSYHNDDWDYPLRKFDARYQYIDSNIIQDITNMLLDPNIQKKDIKTKHQINLQIINKINNGENGYRIKGVKYPIRKKHKKKYVKELENDE